MALVVDVMEKPQPYQLGAKADLEREIRVAEQLEGVILFGKPVPMPSRRSAHWQSACVGPFLVLSVPLAQQQVGLLAPSHATEMEEQPDVAP